MWTRWTAWARFSLLSLSDSAQDLACNFLVFSNVFFKDCWFFCFLFLQPPFHTCIKQQDITAHSRCIISTPAISLQLPRICDRVLVTDYCPLYQLPQKASSTGVPTSSSDSPHKDRFQFGNLPTHLTNANNRFSFSFKINLFFQVILILPLGPTKTLAGCLFLSLYLSGSLRLS